MAYQPEIEKLERKYQDDPARHFAQLAEQYRRADRLDEALDILTRHLEERPNYVSGLIVLGRCYLDRRDDAAARETFERVLALDAEHIIALKALGDLADRAGDGPEAIRWLERLLEVDPMNEDAQASLERIKTEGPMGPLEEEVAEGAGAAEAAATEPLVDPTPEFSAPQPEPPALIETAPVAEPEPESAPEPEPPAAPEAVETAAAADDDELKLERATPAFEPSPEPVPESLLDEVFGRSEPGDDASTLPAEATGDDAPASGLAEAAETADVEEAESATTPPALEGAEAAGMEFQSFDTELAWDTGDRTSQQISDEDLIAAEHLHSDDVEPVAHELPGLETAFVPPVGDEASGIEPVEGLGGVAPVDAEGAGEAAGAEEPPAPAEQGGSVAEGPEAAGEAEAAGEPQEAPGESDEAAGEPEEAEQPAAFELEAVVEVEEEVVVEETVEERGSLTGLPLILPPEELEAEAEPEPVAEEAASAVPSDEGEPEQEPEPVVTETMAELYARQGLASEAADVYRQLLSDRPGDPRLTARLRELERHERVSASSPGLAGRYRASETNGQSAREFLGQILASRPGAAAVPEAPPAPEAPSAPDAASDEFADQPVHPRGNPTQPASNDISLASAFGENPPEPPAQRPSGFSFDEFFGGTPPAAPPPASERPSHAAERDDEGDAAFRQWLKGLKS